MGPLTRCAVACCLALFAVVTHAALEVRFTESAPKDRFTVSNVGKCDSGPFELTIDLSKSAAGLIFDTTAEGAGVEVYQPFAVSTGQVTLTSGASVRDGDKSLSVKVSGLAPGARVAFTIDVDDTLAASELGQIRVSGAEIAGAIARIDARGQEPVSGSFDKTGRTLVDTLPCG
ncbi:MAG: hypothetical protein AAF458_05480 [Pseudomonadota bacterium]